MTTDTTRSLGEQPQAARSGMPTDAFEWHPRELTLPFSMGEWRIRDLHFHGLSAQPEPFSTAPLADPQPPTQTLADRRAKAAFLYSCPVAGSLPVLALCSGWLRYTTSQYPHYFVDVSGRFEDYLAGFRGKTLSTLRRKIRRATATNTRRPVVQRYASAEAFAEFFELALPISRQSYQQRLFGEGLPETQAFRDDVARRAEAGEVTGFIAFIEDRPAAYTLCPRTAPGVVLYDHTGYDPACEQWSPGTVLQHAIIESLFADPQTRIYDLCTGGGRHKELFASGHQDCANIWFLRPLSWQAGAACLHRGLALANGAIKRLLGHLRLRDRVKKMMRRA